MLTALLDGVVEYEARNVDRLSEAERDALRGRWSCPSCGSEAYFVRRSRNGRSAKFASRYHADDCVEQSQSGTAGEEASTKIEVTPISNDASHLVLRLEGFDGVGAARGKSRANLKGKTGRRHTGQGVVRQRHEQSHGLASLLSRLSRDPAFRKDTRPFRLDDGTWTTIRDCCVHADDFTQDRLGQRVIVWGSVFNASGSWVNSGPKGLPMPAILFTPDSKLMILAKNRIDDIDELNDHLFIAVATFYLTRYLVPYARVQAQHVAFLPKKSSFSSIQS